MSKFTVRFALLVVCLIPLFSAHAGITRTWTGSVSNNFSEPNNWSPAGVPASDDSLVFPSATVNNDLPAGTSFGPMTFNGYVTLNGNAMTLTGDVTVANGVLLTCNADVVIGAAVQFSNSGSQRYGSIDVNGHALTILGSATIQSLNGSGTVTGGTITVQQSGTFSGSITAILTFSGSMPNANLVHSANGFWPWVAGTGTLGTVEAQRIAPGDGGVGTISTRSLHLYFTTPGVSTAFFDLNAAGASDLLQVTGTVTLDNPALSVSLSGTPASGQQFKIIDNDGSDPVTGTFLGLAEGATVNVGVYAFTISYHGGDGNDVVLTAPVQVKTWNGSVNGLWSNPGNWTPNAIPVSGEPLQFPAGANMTNDLPGGTAVGALTFQGSATLNGNALTVNGDVKVLYPYSLTCNAALKIGTSLTIGDNVNFSGSQYFGSVDVNGQTLKLLGATTFQSLNGSGTVNGSFVTVMQGGTFSGPLNALTDIHGSMPNANVTGNLTGDGEVGTLDAVHVSPGEQNANHIGTLKTKSLHATLYPGFGVALDLVAGGTSDQIQVAGTVTLDNPVLILTVTGVPSAGQTFKLIDNDGTDPVNGTFNVLPEGATVNVNGTYFVITYHGGDGNDVVLTAATPLKTWNGSVNGLWSNPGNWTPNAIPVAGEPLLFPAGGTMTNDLPAGTVFGPMTFNGTTTLNGNAMTLTGDVKIAFPYTFTCNADIKIGTSLALGNLSGLPGSQSYASIDVNGQTLTIAGGASMKTLNGTGTVFGGSISVLQDSTFSGQLNSLVDIHGSMPNANVNGNLTGVGTIGTVDTIYIAPGNPSGNPVGTLKTKSLRVTVAAGFGAAFDLNAAGASDLIQVSGTVTLQNAPLIVTLNGTPVFGQHFLLIDNDGTDPVSGSFLSLPEGAAVNLNGYPFRVTYVGGDGNDVELYMATNTSAALSQSMDTSLSGQPVTFEADVTAPVGAPQGTVTFFDDGVAFGTAPVSGGTATLSASALSVGSHTITAVYSGGGAFYGSTSGPVTHTVSKGHTTTTVDSVHTPVVFGAADFRVTSTPVAPAGGDVAGTFTLREGTKVLGTGPMADGSGHLFLPTLGVGTHTIVATYSGSSAFIGSDSAPLTIEVTAAPTQVQASVEDGATVANGTVLNVIVVPLTSATVPPSGTITVSEGHVVWSQAPITGSLSETLKLPAGHHVLSIVYSGDSNFLSSSTEVGVDIEGAPPARRRGAHH